MKKFNQFTQIDELSKDTLHSYMVKATKEKKAGGKDRTSGVMRAWKKSERKVMEDVEQVDEVSTGKLVDYVAAASRDVGRRIEKNEPGIEPFKKTLKRSGHIGRAMARIKIKSKANEQNDMCNVCGQTPCNCTNIEEGTVDDKIDKVGKIYNAHRVLADKARQQYPKDREGESYHMGKSNKAFNLMHNMRIKKAEANKSNPKPRPKPYDPSFGGAIAQDYKDQEAKRGIGHVRDSVEMDGSNMVSELSVSTLRSYIGKAKAQKDYKQGVYNMRHQGLAAGKTHADWSPEGRAIVKKRNAGIGQAHTKVIDKQNAAMREEIEQVEEGTERNKIKRTWNRAMTSIRMQNKANGKYVKGTTAAMNDNKKTSNTAHPAGKRDAAADTHNTPAAVKNRAEFKSKYKVTKEGIEQVDEISQELKNRYVERAVTAHGGYNMARRNTTGKMKEYFARKEANTKKGISRALRKEEVEQVDEISKELANRYMYSAFADRKKTDDEMFALRDRQDTLGHNNRNKISKRLKRSDKRTTGISRALQRITKEEVEQISELSKDTVKRYKDRASLRCVGRACDIYDREVEGGKKPDPEQHRKLAVTVKGLDRANARLAKEDIEQVDELRTSTLLRYATKAGRSADKLGGEAGRAIDSGDRATAAQKFTKRDNRFKGIIKARAKITGKK